MTQTNPSCFSFDTRIYSLTTIKKAAYRFSGQFLVELAYPGQSEILVTLTPKSDAPFLSMDARDFPNEVLDQDLRERVANETKCATELILAQAFSELSIIDPVGESADYHDDPLKIAGPFWSITKNGRKETQ